MAWVFKLLHSLALSGLGLQTSAFSSSVCTFRLCCESKTKVYHSVGTDITVIVTVFLDFATDDLYSSSLANNHFVPTRFQALDCTLDQLSLLTLLHNLCVIRITAKMQAQILRAKKC